MKGLKALCFIEWHPVIIVLTTRIIDICILPISDDAHRPFGYLPHALQLVTRNNLMVQLVIYMGIHISQIRQSSKHQTFSIFKV